MNKRITIANYILAKNMQDIPAGYILEKVQELYPDKGLTRGDVHNALTAIRDGYLSIQPNTVTTPAPEPVKRKRYTALQHGDYADAASFVAKSVAGRFNQEQRVKFLQILTDKLA